MRHTNRITAPAYTLVTLLLIQAAALAASAIDLGGILHGVASIILHGQFTSLGGLFEDNPIVGFLFAIHDAYTLIQSL